MPNNPAEPVVAVIEEKPVEEAVETIHLSEEKPVELSSEDKIAAKVKADFESLYGGRLEQIENRLKGSYRINERLQKENEQLKAQVTQPKPAAPVVEDELDALVQKDWKAAVAKIASDQANQLYQQRIELDRLTTQQQNRERLLETSKQTVIQQYPDLDPETGNPESEISKAYVAELNKDQSLLSNEHGPEIAMYRMQQTLGEPKVKAVGANAEVIRRQRVAAGSLTPSRTSTGDQTVTVTKDQKDFYEYWGIDPKQYAKISKALEQGGGVEAP